MGRTRRKFSSEEKLKMVMAVIQDGKAVSDAAQENNVHPNKILNWKKEFLENLTSRKKHSSGKSKNSKQSSKRRTK